MQNNELQVLSVPEKARTTTSPRKLTLQEEPADQNTILILHNIALVHQTISENQRSLVTSYNPNPYSGPGNNLIRNVWKAVKEEEKMEEKEEGERQHHPCHSHQTTDETNSSMLKTEQKYT
ncbi:hypothetical protein KOW79_022782 [Hemibagrus wyckioides]|uniref:Uncharacterized protein n=1 Tax=Hemibagrus wyckioides TaxID=337641 RepID=A0A9D3S7P0_9TELE|nr:hypothetical protein KOW79_022782 [Hemibagrus wyckioides]